MSVKLRGRKILPYALEDHESYDFSPPAPSIPEGGSSASASISPQTYLTQISITSNSQSGKSSWNAEFGVNAEFSDWEGIPVSATTSLDGLDLHSPYMPTTPPWPLEERLDGDPSPVPSTNPDFFGQRPLHSESSPQVHTTNSQLPVPNLTPTTDDFNTPLYSSSPGSTSEELNQPSPRRPPSSHLGCFDTPWYHSLGKFTIQSKFRGPGTLLRSRRVFVVQDVSSERRSVSLSGLLRARWGVGGDDDERYDDDGDGGGDCEDIGY